MNRDDLTIMRCKHESHVIGGFGGWGRRGPRTGRRLKTTHLGLS